MAGVDRTALLLVGVLALQAGLSYFHFLSFATVGQRSLVDLRRDTYARLISLPMTFFAQRRVGELASRLSADLIQIEDTLTAILPQFLRQSTLLVGGIALIAVTSLQLTGIMLLSLPLVIAVAVIFGRKTRMNLQRNWRPTPARSPPRPRRPVSGRKARISTRRSSRL